MKLTPSELKHANVLLRAEVPAFAKRLAPVYAALEWEWTSVKGVPNAEWIEKVLLDIIDTWQGRNGSTRTGGLEVWKDGREVGLAFTDSVSIEL